MGRRSISSWFMHPIQCTHLHDDPEAEVDPGGVSGAAGLSQIPLCGDTQLQRQRLREIVPV